MNQVSVARLRKLFTYDPATGTITRKQSAGCRMAGATVDSAERKGYLRTNVDGQRLKAHKICWALHTGFWPDLQVDHINGNTADNRLSNLRLATNQQNAANQRTPKNNTSGTKGVSARNGRWVAGIKIDGVRIHLGTFNTRELAAAAYAAAASSAFGSFARTA